MKTPLPWSNTQSFLQTNAHTYARTHTHARTHAHTHTHTFRPWHISSRYEVFHFESFIRIFWVSTHSQQNSMTCWDWWGCWNPNREVQKGKILQLHWTHHTYRTRLDRTAQRQGAEREGRVSEVESESRAEGTSACDDFTDVGVFQFFSHLIFGPFVQGFSIALKLWGA